MRSDCRRSQEDNLAKYHCHILLLFLFYFVKVPKAKVFKTFVAVVSFFVVQKMRLSSADEYSTFKSHGHVTFVDMRRDSNDKCSRIFIQINNKLSSNKKKKMTEQPQHVDIQDRDECQSGRRVGPACHQSRPEGRVPVETAECETVDRKWEAAPTSAGFSECKRMPQHVAYRRKSTTERNAGMFKMFHCDSRPDWSFTGRKGLHIEQHCCGDRSHRFVQVTGSS